MADTVILIPWRGDDGGRRDKLHAHVQKWLIHLHPDWPIFYGDSPGGAFNRGAAINDAAHKADEVGPWDVAVIHDADTIADAGMLKKAVERVKETGGTCYPYSSYIYLDRASSERLMAGTSWLVAPEYLGDGYRRTVRYHHVSGVQVMHRDAYDAIGGYIELPGWGAEDEVVNVMLNTYSVAPEWLEGGAWHLWHPHTRNDPSDELQEANQVTLAEVAVLAGRPMEMRDFLAKGGHTVP